MLNIFKYSPIGSTFIMALVISTSSYAKEPYRAKVVGVTDGDTITILTKNKERKKVRLAEIDCPEKKQPWGQNAKEAASSYLFGEKVKIKEVSIDRYKRVIAIVHRKKKNINHKLVQEGHCWVYRKYSKSEILISAENEARSKKRGLWNLQSEQISPPWEWRSTH